MAAVEIQWDKAKVITALRKLRRKGNPISYAHINRTQSSLASAACRYFGTYRAAVIAAGIDYDGQVRKLKNWSIPLVIQDICRRYRLKEDLSPAFITQNANPLYQASLKYFGSYRQAVIAAGIDYQGKVLRPFARQWPENRVLSEIRRLHRAGKDLAYNSMRRVCEPLIFAAARRFGTYAAAVEAAGIRYASVKAVRRWNPDRVVAALRKLHKIGKDISSAGLKRINGPLYAAIRRHFSTYAAALAKAGIDSGKVRRNEQWTRARVLDELKRLHQSRKKTVNASRTHPNLVGAARRLFGSYAATMRSIGAKDGTEGHSSGKRLKG